MKALTLIVATLFYGVIFTALMVSTRENTQAKPFSSQQVDVLKEIRNEIQEAVIRLDRMCEAQERIANTFGAVEIYNEKGGLVSGEK